DLAFLAVESPAAALPLAGRYDFRRGQEVTVIGNPGTQRGEGTLENAVSRGIMSAQAKLRGQGFYQPSIAGNPGSSGGPCFDLTGQVIGVVTLKSRTEEGMAFCVPWKELHEAAAKARARTEEEAVQATALHDAQVLFQRVAVAGALYGEAMDV